MSTPANTQARTSQPRRRGRRQNHAQADALTRADLRAIWRYYSRQSRLTDDANERFLHTLLLKGLPATQVPDVAPWARRRGVEHYVDKANADRRIPDADRLGELIEFEFDDLKAMKRDGHSVRHVAPFDVQRGDFQQFWEDEERKADRERKQRARKQRKENTMPTLTKRAKIVHKALNGTNWTSVSDIMEAVVLRDQRNRRLGPTVLRVAVHRALDELAASGLIEESTEAGERGLPTRFVRRAHMTGQVSVSDNNAVDNRNASGDVATR